MNTIILVIVVSLVCYNNPLAQIFTKVTGDPVVSDDRYSEGSSWGDINNDGHLDLFVPDLYNDKKNILFMNNGDGTFTQITSGPVVTDVSTSSGGSFGDFDLFVTNYLGNDNILYENNGDGTFTKITEGIIVNDGGDSVSSSWADYDNDGDLDLYVTNDFNENNYLYENNGDDTFTKITTGDQVNDGGRSNGATWADYNNDGYLDLFVPNGQRPDTQSNILYRNNRTFNNFWINVKCIGTSSNKTAIGIKVRVKALITSTQVWQLRQVSGCTGFNAQNSFNVEFGIGDASIVDSLIFDWPSGLVDVYTDVDVNYFYEAIEGVGLNPILTSVQSGSIFPTTIELYQNYPNPFNPSTTIEYYLPYAGEVKFVLLNVLGQEVKTLENIYKNSGYYNYNLEMKDFSSGVYFYNLIINNYSKTKKLIYLR